MMAQLSEPLSLLALPCEVKRLICAQLCSHCCEPTAFEAITASPDAEGDARVPPSLPLKNLSETCTVWRDVAQPFLYHLPHIRSYSRFLRTLREREDLADCVRCLPDVHLHLYQLGQDMDKDGLAVLKKAAAELQMMSVQDEPLEEEFSQLLAFLSNLAQGKEVESILDGAFGELVEFTILVYTVLIASLPCLEAVYIAPYDGNEYSPLPSYHHAKRRLDRMGRLASSRCPEPSMQSLRTIILQAWLDFGAFGEEEDGGRAGFDLSEALFRCAAWLRELIFDGCDAPYMLPFVPSEAIKKPAWSPLRTVSAITFQDMRWGDGRAGPFGPTILGQEQDVAYSHLRQLATQCSRLASFKMAVAPLDGPQHVNPFSPNKLTQSLLTTAARLETLSIQMAKVCIQPDPAILVGAAIHRFTRLQRLSLDEMCFCSHWLPSHDGSKSCCLVDVLPATVTSLSVWLRRRPRAMPDLVQLGRRAASGAFLNLAHLTVESYLLPAMDQDGTELENFFSQRDYWPASLQNPQAAQEQVQELTAMLVKAFRNSKVVLEVMEIRTRQVHFHSRLGSHKLLL